jgi:hypothetical protein
MYVSLALLPPSNFRGAARYVAHGTRKRRRPRHQHQHCTPTNQATNAAFQHTRRTSNDPLCSAMMQHRNLVLLCRRFHPIGSRYPPAVAKTRCRSTSSSSKTEVPKDEKHLKWTERKEAPKWLQRMAPQKGGTELPDAKTSALIFVVASAGFYAWFIDPPKRAEERKATSKAI